METVAEWILSQSLTKDSMLQEQGLQNEKRFVPNSQKPSVTSSLRTTHSSETQRPAAAIVESHITASKPSNLQDTPEPGHDGRSFDLSEWILHQRKATKTTIAMCCPLCGDRKVLPNENSLWSHVLDVHADRVPQMDNQLAFEKFREELNLQALSPITPRSIGDDSKPRSSYNRHGRNEERQSHGQLHTLKPPTAAKPGTTPLSPANPTPSNTQDNLSRNLEALSIVRQLEVKPISRERLDSEVERIYASLVDIEEESKRNIPKQLALARAGQSKLTHEHFRDFNVLQQRLIYRHHDFFSASQHPLATSDVKKLALEYKMPARLWQYGIHSHIELLRILQPLSHDHLLQFFGVAYSMMCLFYETIPAFEDIWIKILGDLARYRLAIGDDDIQVREVWDKVAQQWHLKASNNSLET